MRRLAVCVAAFTLWGCGDEEGEAALVEEAMPERVDLFPAIDPRIGTSGVGFGVGSTYPGPAVPFGMIHASPDTRTQTGAFGAYHCAGYFADDPIIGGFSLLHFEGTGVPDYGTVGLMPTLGMTEKKRDQVGHMRGFDKSSELTLPGYYTATLDDGVKVEITSARRAAMFRFSFPDSAEPVLLLDSGASARRRYPRRRRDPRHRGRLRRPRSPHGQHELARRGLQRVRARRRGREATKRGDL